MHKSKDTISATPIRSDNLPALPDIKRTQEFIEFARWCVTPSWLREDANQKKLAERIGVSEDSLSDWKRHPKFWPLVWQFVLNRMKEQVPDVIEGLYGKIASGKGNAGDVQLFLRLVRGGSIKPEK